MNSNSTSHNAFCYLYPTRLAELQFRHRANKKPPIAENKLFYTRSGLFPAVDGYFNLIEQHRRDASSRLGREVAEFLMKADALRRTCRARGAHDRSAWLQYENRILKIVTPHPSRCRRLAREHAPVGMCWGWGSRVSWVRKDEKVRSVWGKKWCWVWKYWDTGYRKRFLDLFWYWGWGLLRH